MNVKFEQVATGEQISALCEVAEMVWHETYDPILPEGQVDYMVEKFQSEPAVRRQIEQENYRYYLISCEGERAGFLGVSPEHERKGELFLSKLYLLSSFRGRGLAGKAFRFAEEITRQLGLGTIGLTVNKQNLHAKEVYEHYGFQVAESVVSDIGAGYVMDDYIMVKNVEAKASVLPSAL